MSDKKQAKDALDMSVTPWDWKPFTGLADPWSKSLSAPCVLPPLKIVHDPPTRPNTPTPMDIDEDQKETEK